jgi:hypothetical protein
VDKDEEDEVLLVVVVVVVEAETAVNGFAADTAASSTADIIVSGDRDGDVQGHIALQLMGFVNKHGSVKLTHQGKVI